MLTLSLFILTLESLLGSAGLLFNSGNGWGHLPKSFGSWILAHKICVSFLFGREKGEVDNILGASEEGTAATYVCHSPDLFASLLNIHLCFSSQKKEKKKSQPLIEMIL